MNNSTKVWAWIAIIIVVIAGIYLVMKSREANQTPDENTILPGDANSITVIDQEPNTLSVTIDSVSLRAPGFVAIHEDVRGTPGAIVGSSALLEAGISSNVSVIADLKPGATYWAMLHTDNGNNIFNPATDLPAADNSGTTVMAMFKVQTATGNVKGETKG